MCLDSDKDIIWRSRIHVHFNYEKNPFPQTAFWRPPFPDVEIVHYCAVGARMDRLERYDFLPNSRGTAVVSNRFYDQICDTFGAEEFNSYRAIVETRKGDKLEARIVNPVNYVPWLRSGAFRSRKVDRERQNPNRHQACGLLRWMHGIIRDSPGQPGTKA